MKSCFHFLNLYPSLQLNILGLVGVSLSLCGSQQEKKFIFSLIGQCSIDILINNIMFCFGFWLLPCHKEVPRLKPVR